MVCEYRLDLLQDALRQDNRSLPTRLSPQSLLVICPLTGLVHDIEHHTLAIRHLSGSQPPGHPHPHALHLHIPGLAADTAPIDNIQYCLYNVLV
jgi:hypothetical protein